MAAEYYLGIDVGSTASKCVIANAQGQIVARGLHAAGAGTAGPRLCVEEALRGAGLASVEDVAASCSTGYGRNLETWAGKQVSELSCHAKGAARLFEGVRTVIDIGGQDAKVLSLSEDGKLVDFVMNDKCAAGTGRFLDVMAGVFGCKWATSQASIASRPRSLQFLRPVRYSQNPRSFRSWPPARPFPTS